MGLLNGLFKRLKRRLSMWWARFLTNRFNYHTDKAESLRRRLRDLLARLGGE